MPGEVTGEALRTTPTARRNPSLADVAKVAGVSSQTVSRVVNGHGNVVAATRERVLEALRAVGYRPNAAARALATGRSRALGVLTFSVSRLGDVRSLSGISTAASRAGYSISLLSLREATTTGVDAGIAHLAGQDVDGLIIIEAEVLDSPVFSVPPSVPLVVTDAVASQRYPNVDTDQAAGAALAVEHLLRLGHRTVHHVGGPRTSRAARERQRSWESTLLAHGRPAPPAHVGDWTSASGYRIGRVLAQRPPGEVSAVFSANDQMALGVLRAFHEAGADVPGDVSVVGFDDIAEAGDYWPPLTTVRQDFEGVGELCVSLLLDQIQHSGPVPARTHRVPVQLVVRASTAPPRT
ncbi:LacI family DNA-binding transcriptional regulator [Kineococcus sp. TBRC 1896]|uniref:LacI family DNA-binding transcriptional regulator n=1 Tax=Kineococcus mangrovi TaxID=1660183 RepID=A0ABV4HY21_9ACTN